MRGNRNDNQGGSGEGGGGSNYGSESDRPVRNMSVKISVVCSNNDSIFLNMLLGTTGYTLNQTIGLESSTNKTMLKMFSRINKFAWIPLDNNQHKTIIQQ